MFSSQQLNRLLSGGYQPEGYWLWDPWIIPHDGGYLLFHLQLPKEYDLKTNVDPALLHHSSKVLDYHSSIGMAWSEDLKNWQNLGTALDRGEPGEWDDLALWTGCALEKDDKIHLFYTGRQSNEFWTQRIGVAVADFKEKNFRKQPANPILSADGYFYGTSKELNDLGMPPAWRDPFVFWDPVDEHYHMILSARTAMGNLYNACIGHAVSQDLLHWRKLAPLLLVEGLDQVENPQLRIHNGKYYLFFSTRKKALNPDVAQVMKYDAGLYGFVADDLSQEFKPLNGNGLVVSQGEQLYSIHVIPIKDDVFAGVGWWQMENGQYQCRMAQPFGIKLSEKRAKLQAEYFF